MKLTAFILLAAMLYAQASTTAQTISFKGSNVSLETIFTAIKKQTGYVVFSSKPLLAASKPVTVDVKEMGLRDFMELILKGQSLVFSIDDKTIMVSRKPTDNKKLANAESLMPPVKIRVTDSVGKPLVGATVVIKNSKVTGVTDAEGMLSVNVNQGDVILISYIGYETRSVVITSSVLSDTNNLIITLRSSVTKLEEVDVTVSTGYQEFSKERATGSFTKIDNATLNLQTGTNILKRLEGVTSGLLFDNNKIKSGFNSSSNDNISIRGVSTIAAPMEPLIVLDGFIYDGNINNINPNDVENITILKDAAAASIWGARAGNGVIVITTKKGKLNQRMQVLFNANVIVNNKPDLYYLPQMSSKDYVEVEEFLFNQGYFNPVIGNPRVPLTPVVELLLKRRKREISAADSAMQIDALKQTDSRDQYLRYLYRNAVTQQYSLNLSGGGTNNSYTVSANYDNLLGQLQGESNKLTLRLEDLFRPTKNISIRLGAIINSSKTTSGALGYNAAERGVTIGSRSVPYIRLVNDNGEASAIAAYYRTSFIDTFKVGKLLDWRYYLLNDWKHQVKSTNVLDIFSFADLRYRIASYLNFDIKYQYERQESRNEELSDIESHYTRNLINLFTQVNNTTGEVTNIIPKGGIKSLSNSTLSSYTLRAQLNLDKTFNDHNIVALFGVEARQFKNDSYSFITYGYQEDPLIYSRVDFFNQYPTILDGSRQSIPPGSGFGSTINRFVSMYANATYSYKQRYLISASARNDGSNIFGANTNDKWKPLWSVGAGWRLSNELFYRSTLLPFLNFRLTYGYSGNVDLSKSALPIGSYSTDSYTGFPVASVQTLNNPNLRWEKSGMLNMGVDFSLKHDVISGSVEYYQKKGTDLYAPALYDYTSWGYTNQVIINSANLKGHGIDILLNTKNIINNSFKWISTFIFNYNTDKVTKYHGAKTVISKIGVGGTSIVPVVGKPLYAIAAYKWGGLNVNGDPMGFVDGKLSIDYNMIDNEGAEKGTDGNLIYIGTTSPKYHGSLSNSLSWKSLTITALISYKFGYFFRKEPISYGLLIERGIGNKDFVKRWKEPGDELYTSVPSFIYPASTNNSARDGFYANSEINVFKGDHIRLQFINLSYSFQFSHDRNRVLKDLQVYSNMANLGILWRANKENIDPEFPSSVLPSKAWTIGIRASF